MKAEIRHSDISLERCELYKSVETNAVEVFSKIKLKYFSFDFRQNQQELKIFHHLENHFLSFILKKEKKICTAYASMGSILHPVYIYTNYKYTLE